MKTPWLDLQIHGDERGALVAIETGKQIPFAIKRVYYIFGTKEGVVRGLHAHKKLRQMTFAVQGACDMLLDNGRERIKVHLNNPSKGLRVEPMIWHEMSNFTPDCVLVVVADELYDPNDYIRSYDDFLNEIKKND